LNTDLVLELQNNESGPNSSKGNRCR